MSLISGMCSGGLPGQRASYWQLYAETWNETIEENQTIQVFGLCCGGPQAGRGQGAGVQGRRSQGN